MFSADYGEKRRSHGFFTKWVLVMLRACKVKQVFSIKKNYVCALKISNYLIYFTRAQRIMSYHLLQKPWLDREGKNVVVAARSGKVHRNLMENVIFPINIGTTAWSNLNRTCRRKRSCLVYSYFKEKQKRRKKLKLNK